MKLFFYMILSMVFIISCSERNDSEYNAVPKKNTNQDVDSLSSTTKSDTIISQEPTYEYTDSVHVFKKGETLWELGRTYYGNRHYSSLIKTYNNIESSNSIKPGSIIKIPTLSYMLHDREIGLNKFINDEIEKILKVEKLISKHYLTLKNQRDSSGYGINLKAPKQVKKDFETAIVLIDEIIVSLKKPDTDSTNTPKYTIDNLKGAKQYINKMLDGYIDSNLKDFDMVQQYMIRTFNSLIIWARNDFK